MAIERDMKDWCDQFKTSQQWLTAVQADKSGSVHTQKSYRLALKVFCDWIEKSPDNLISERRVQLKNPETEMDMENKVRAFCVMLESSRLQHGQPRPLSRTTIATRYHGPIRSFFKYNNVPLKLKTFKHVKKERQPHTIEEIKALLEVADVREKAVIMLLKDSGISREDAIKLKYSDIQADYEATKDTVHIHLTRTKESVVYDTFIGKNAIEALRALIEYRKRQGEEITSGTSLIAQLNGQPTTPENLSQMFIRLGKKAGFYTSPHRFRKFFMSRLGLVVPSLLVKSWLGHSLGVESSYFLPDLQKQREAYAKAYSELDLTETKAIEEIEKIKEEKKLTNGLHEQRIQELENTIKTLKESLIEIPRGAKEFTEKIRHGDFVQSNSQKIIEEPELASYMEKGWKFVSALPSGKLVVTHE